MMIPAGWLAERYGAHKVLAAGIAIWSVATLLTGFVSSFPALIALRLLLGVGESATFPCLSKLIASGVDPIVWVSQMALFPSGICSGRRLARSPVGFSCPIWDGGRYSSCSVACRCFGFGRGAAWSSLNRD